MSTNLQELATKLKDALSVDEVDTNHVTKIMEGYTSNPKDWQKFTLWDQHKYVSVHVDVYMGRSLCCQTAECNLSFHILVCDMHIQFTI
jgi:hypothetical protein